MTKLSSTNQMIGCSACGNLTHSQVRGTSVRLCPACLDAADLENAHADGAHDESPHATCPDCQAPQAPKSSSIGARLEARGMRIVQKSAAGKHTVEVYYREARVFSGERDTFVCWANSFAGMYSFERMFVSRPEFSFERFPFAISVELPSGPHGWSTADVSALDESEARTLAESARKMKSAKRVHLKKWNGRSYEKIA